ncbi:MAG: ABC transporter permease [Desulfobacterales bacterium]|jgi:simple sugar transport system permease protein
MGDFFQTTIIVSILAATVRIATPLLLAALGELIAERAGILNLGVEGNMLMSAFFGFLFTYISGSLWVGLLAALLAGALMNLLMVFMAATLKVEQVVTGLALNMLASGLSLFLYKAFFSGSGNKLPTIQIFEVVEIPFLSSIPYVGEILFSQKILTYTAFAMVPAVWFFLYRTPYGLEIRCLGENPKVIDTKGLNVTLRQYLAVICGGLLIGLGGAFVTIGSTVRFIPEITAGRGWLALVIVIAGNWKPGGILIAALIFAFLEAFQLQVQGVGVQLPYQLLLALPYVVAIVLMVLKRGVSEEPGRLAVPYFRGER